MLSYILLFCLVLFLLVCFVSLFVWVFCLFVFTTVVVVKSCFLLYWFLIQYMSNMDLSDQS